MHKEDLALNDPQRLICSKTKPKEKKNNKKQSKSSTRIINGSNKINIDPKL